MLIARVAKSITETIDKSNTFKSTDFSVVSKKEYRGTDLRITYTLDNRFVFYVKIPDQIQSDGTYDFEGTVCPGNLSFEEKIKFSAESALYSNITRWLNSLWSELITASEIRESSNRKKDIEDTINQFSELPDEFFSREEISTLSKKLDDLASQLKDELERNSKNKNELEKQIASLNSDISNLKTTLNFSKKEPWKRSFVTRAYDWFKDPENRQILTEGIKLIKELMPDNSGLDKKQINSETK